MVAHGDVEASVKKKQEEIDAFAHRFPNSIYQRMWFLSVDEVLFLGKEEGVKEQTR